MAKKPNLEILAQAWELYQEGLTIPQVQQETGLNYSQAWYFIRSCELTPEQALELSGENVRLARLSHKEADEMELPAISVDPKGDSWGYIAVRCQVSESEVRRAFEEATELKSKGLRTGKGGRFAYNEPRLYQGEHARTGVRISRSQKGRPPLPEEVEMLNGYKLPQLKELAAKCGAQVEGKVTKGKLIQAILSTRA